MEKDMIRLEAVKDEKGNVTHFELEILDNNFWTVYKGTLSIKEYANLISGAYTYNAIESDR